MFSSPQNTSGGPAMATRSRRRQRNPSGDAALTQQPKPKRPRGPLTDSTLTKSDAQNAQPEMLEVKNSKVAKLPKPDGLENAPPTSRALRSQVAVRSKKPKQGERTSKSDGSIELTKTNAYTVSKLQALPDRVRADPAARQHGVLDASNGCALCVTHTHAFVWQYASTTPSPETFTFSLPYPSKHASDPLPLGALVSPGSAAEEPGLVVVMPVSGKVSFWEHISSAATLDYFRQQKSGVEETVPGMWTGEHIMQLIRADSASFILSFSSGRVAHLSVRDSQGKPGISVQFLRSTRGPSSSVFDSFLGGLRTAIKSAVQGNDLAAVRVDPFNRAGLKNVVAATKSGRLNAWRVQRGGHHELIASVDARESILQGLQRALPPITANIELELLDFTFVPRGVDDRHKQASRLSEALFKDAETIQHLLLLVSLSDRRQSQYALVEVEVEGDSFKVGMVRTISSYTTPVNPSATDRPRLHLPRPALVAFIIFDRAVVIASLAAPPETPDSQLQEENHIIPATFEDVIDLRSEDSLEIVGTGLEEPLATGQESEGLRSHRPRTKSPTALLMIRGIGVVKVALSEVERFASDQPPEVTAKGKLEQAVFYGLKDDNPLVFEGRRTMPFSHEEISSAALELSEDILASKSSFLSGAPAATEINLRQRSAWLDKLMSHLKAQKVELSRATKWQLLSNAEKLNMAREIWKLHERFLSERSGHEKKTIISEAIEYINEEEKKVPNRAAGEIDRARTWFLHDSWRLDVFLPWTFQVIKHLRKTKLADDATMTRFMYEAAHVFDVTLSGALEFRKRKLDSYGLGGEHVQYGILTRLEDYDGLPRFWTSTNFICEYFYRLIELCQAWLGTHYPPANRAGGPDPGLIESLRDTMPSLINQLVLTLNESIRWSEANADEDADADGTLFSEKCRNVLESSTSLILRLKDFGLWEGALSIAEKYRDNKALADLIVARLVDLSDQLKKAAPGAVDELAKEVEAKKKQLLECMGEHGPGFAYEAYQTLLVYGGPSMVLDFSHYDKFGHATSFLRTQPLGKISWINDIEHEKDLSTAAKTLIDVGEKEEQVWCKKIELSLGKLSLLAEGAGAEPASAAERSKAAKHDAELAGVEQKLEIIRIQDRTYQLLAPAFQDALDDVAAVELAMPAFTPKVPKKYKVLYDDLQAAMGELVAHKAMAPLPLINLLTLIRLTDLGAETRLFCSAILVAELGLQGEQKQQALRLIWRRCYIRDEWQKVNSTENMNDQAVSKILSMTQAYSTMVACMTYYLNLKDVGAKHESSYILTPDEALNVFTSPQEEPFGTEGDAPTLLEKRAEAMRWEDATLKKFIDKNQLTRWAQAAVEHADRTVRFSGDAGANGNGFVNGNGKKANGHVLNSIEGDDGDDQMDDDVDEIA
ncbi:unnamed protein product [Discula destructiva]